MNPQCAWCATPLLSTPIRGLWQCPTATCPEVAIWWEPSFQQLELVLA